MNKKVEKKKGELTIQQKHPFICIKSETGFNWDSWPNAEVTVDKASGNWGITCWKNNACNHYFYTNRRSPPMKYHSKSVTKSVFFHFFCGC